ncbi:MAG: LPS assembly lipoprotein LptE [Thermodesulfobacteriota bacterium]|nr:LPS assembly lipoprotein LptE [Thermodesulfobacteriota bacterium]
MKRKWIIYVLLLLPFLGCGYHFSTSGENIDAGIRKVFIGEFSNSTSEANVENYIRNAFFNRFRRENRFTTVADRNQADAFLTGKIRNITTSHIAYSSSDMAKENRVFMTLEVMFKRADNGGVIWINKDLSGREAYKVEVDTAITAANKRKAIRKLSVDMADKAYRNIVSGF